MSKPVSHSLKVRFEGDAGDVQAAFTAVMRAMGERYQIVPGTFVVEPHEPNDATLTWLTYPPIPGGERATPERAEGGKA